MRAGNRPVNKGLRLDYFVCDREFILDEKEREDDGGPNVIIRDSYMDLDQEGSDQCPVIVEIEIKAPKAEPRVFLGKFVWSPSLR